ncbi:MAG: cyclic nucleotide-binding/CBS domain-containing protein [bacterium]
MLISDCMKREVKTVSTGTTVASAVKEMANHNVGSLVIVENQRPVGIFTERDLLKRVVAPGKDPAKMKIGDVMTKDVFTVEAGEFIGNVYHSLTEKGIRHAPVVEKGVLVGIVSARDLARILDAQIYSLYFKKKDLSGDY